MKHIGKMIVTYLILGIVCLLVAGFVVKDGAGHEVLMLTGGMFLGVFCTLLAIAGEPAGKRGIPRRDILNN